MLNVRITMFLLLVAGATISTIEGAYFSGCSVYGTFYCHACDIFCVNLNLEVNTVITLPGVSLNNTKHLKLVRTHGEIDQTTLQELPNLRSITLRHSNITAFGPQDLSKLQELFILSSSLARITSLDCCKNLTIVCILGRNQIDIEDGALKNLNKLETLRLSLLNVTRLDRSFLEGLKSLTFLDISSNSIKEIDEDTFTAVPKLKKLCLEIKTNASLEFNTFKPLKELKILTIYGDGLNVLDLGMFTEQKNLYSLGLPTKTWLQLNPDEIIKVFPNLTSFTSDRDCVDRGNQRKLDEIFHKLRKNIHKNCRYCMK